MLIGEAALTRYVTAVFRRGGSEPPEAELVARHLVDANLAGHDSHGVGMVPTYVRHLDAGLVVPNTPVKLAKDDGAVLMFEGGRGYGRRVAGEAMAAAVERCRATGVVVMTLCNAHHIARVGAYGEMAIAAGLCSVHFVNVTDHAGLVAPYRGTDSRFSTIPICVAVPGTAGQAPIVLDMATSEIAFGKVRVARNQGRPLPEPFVIDPAGRPTTDPGVMFAEPRGSILPFGRHKGYGLAVIAELLAGGLSGGGTIQPDNARLNGVVNNMTTFLVDPARLAGADWLAREVDGFVSYVKASPPADAAAPVLVPGDPERAAMAERRRDGIPIDDATWEELLAAGAKVGLTREEARALSGA
jgi:uncharacterized oxidoreductase